MEARWLGPVEIRAIEGALKPSAYVARAYKETLANHGIPPGWARKRGKGQWLFLEGYVMEDARENLASISVAEAAGMLGATRRAVQNWVDSGDIASVGGPGRGKGERRRILREQFVRDLPRLRERLKTPAVLGYRLIHGQATPPPVAPPGTQVETVSGDARSPDAGKPGPVVGPAAAEPAAGAVKQSGRGLTLKERIAAIEAQLRRARSARQKLDAPVEKAQAATDALARSSAVASTEAQFKAARAAKQKEAELEDAARKTAEKLMGGVFGGELDRIDAAIIFNQYATQHRLPDDIRNRIRKEYFGK